MSRVWKFLFLILDVVCHLLAIAFAVWLTRSAFEFSDSQTDYEFIGFKISIFGIWLMFGLHSFVLFAHFRRPKSQWLDLYRYSKEFGNSLVGAIAHFAVSLPFFLGLTVQMRQFRIGGYYTGPGVDFPVELIMVAIFGFVAFISVRRIRAALRRRRETTEVGVSPTSA